MRTLRLPLALLWAAGCAGADPSTSTEEVVLGRTVIEVAGNPTCSDYLFGFKIDPPQSRTFVIDKAGNTVTVTVDGVHVTWSSTISMDEVIVKGGPGALIYSYSPESFADEGLVAPTNPNNGEPYGLSHIDFCFDYEVAVDKTATTSLTRTYPWTIDKTSTLTSVVLAAGEQLLVPYDVALALGTPVDSDWAVAGVVTVTNPAPLVATLTGIADTIGQVEVALDCGVTLPFDLAPAASLVCSYSLPLTGPTAGVNTVEVTTTGAVGGGSASEPFDFAAPTVDPVDDCVTVTDDLAGPLGTVCVADAPYTFHYTFSIGPYDVGEYQVVNVASFVTDDTGATGSDSWTIDISVPPTGCTLTPGYWKTHSLDGPAPYDDAWALLPSGEEANTVFFLSTLTYHDVLWTPPAGNAYFILAHAYIGAELNVLNGAGLVPAAHDAFDGATALFNAYTPAQIALLKGKAATEVRATFIALAGTLDAFNNGLIGPGHCNE